MVMTYVMKVSLVGLAIVFTILGSIIIFSFSGRYVTKGERGLVFIIDRFTGTVKACTVRECWYVPEPKLATDGKPDDWITPKSQPPDLSELDALIPKQKNNKAK
jgi:hypothetical protein